MERKRKPLELSPSDIRRIRERVGLSQAEAGELLGGGPRAFTKYENGTIKPSASVANLLRTLDANPGALSILAGRKLPPVEHDGTKPFEVTGQHIAALSERRLVNLTRRLLAAEAQSGDLPMDGIHVSAVITAPDGGEDAKIEWHDGPSRTKFLPSRHCQFQLKAGDLSPADAGAEPLAASGEIKPMVRSALEAGGTYIMACGHSYTNNKIKTRVHRIQKALTEAGLTIGPEQVQFRDADQIALWVNAHPPVAAWVLEQTQPGLVGIFRDWSHWAGRYDAQPWIADSRFEPFRDKLRKLVSTPRGIARVVGLSGYGKSRLVHEALGPTPAEEASAPRLSDLVLYTVESEAGPTAVKNLVQSLADSGVRAIVVVDRCPNDSHQDLAAMVKRASSRLSLITIDYERPPSSPVSDEVLLVDRADDVLIQGMIEHIAPDLPSEDKRRLVKFAQGFPQIASLLGQSWLKASSIATATDDELFDRIILGRKPSDEALLKEAGMLLGAFGLLGVKHPLKDLDAVAPLTRNRTPSDLRAALDELIQRGVVKQHGRLVSLQPKPVAMALAERQWRQWDGRWDDILAGSLNLHLRRGAARQLALLNNRDISLEVVRYVCRLNGPFATLEGLQREGTAEILSSLAEIDALAVVTLLERVIGCLPREQLKQISGDVRRHIVWALEKIAFVEGTFERGALLLLDLAVAENEKWGNNSTGQFKDLFPVFLGGTVAGAEPRLRLLKELVAQNDLQRIPIVVDALLKASDMHSHSRAVGAETHGSRPALESWHPKLWKDAWDYVIPCLDMLAELAKRDDAIGNLARSGMAHGFRTLVSAGLIERVEGWVRDILAIHRYWPEALNALGDVLQYDSEGLDADVEIRLRKLIAELSPDNLEDRVRFLVTEMPWDYPIDEKLEFSERNKRQVEVVEELTRELLKQPDLLKKMLPQMSVGSQRMATTVGISMAKFSDAPHEWAVPTAEAIKTIPEDQRNFGLLAGFFSELAAREPEIVEGFKQQAARSPVFAPAVPLICAHVGITEADITLVCESLQSRVTSPHLMTYWTMGGVLAKLPPAAVVPLFDQMLAMDGQAYSVALDLIGMYVHGEPTRLDNLRKQLIAVAESVGKRPKRRGSQMDVHHFEQIIGWLLNKGRDDADARNVAVILAKHSAADPDGPGKALIEPVLPVLLSKFGTLVWPIFGQTLVADRAKAWRMEHLLGDSYSFAENKNPAILNVSEDTLFAWCHANPDVGPSFLATIAPVLTTRSPEATDRAFHPFMKRLLDEFGGRDDVLKKLVQNMHTFGWTGSRTTYYALYEQPLRQLESHPIGAVRRWAQTMLTHMAAEIQSAKIEDDEQRAHWDV